MHVKGNITVDNTVAADTNANNAKIVLHLLTA